MEKKLIPLFLLLPRPKAINWACFKPLGRADRSLGACLFSHFCSLPYCFNPTAKFPFIKVIKTF